MELDKEELEKLPAAERLAKLKELEEEKKTEIEEVEKLIKESEKQARIDERIKDNVEIPKQEDVEITDLFTEEELAQTEKKEEDSEETGATLYHTESGEFWSTYSGLNVEESTAKMDESMKYEPKGKEDAETSVASRGIGEQVKKYSKG